MFGGVVYDDADGKWICSIIEFSTLGARIKTDASLEIGGLVNLKINKYNDLRRAQVIWIKDGQIGFRFLVKVDETKKGISSLLKLSGSGLKPPRLS